ncbi:unnamed protein product [Symbiodinium sp. CCMP2592]|nr:unnamed protein product [Symbiodinium sp. CCMP2592]
MDIVPFIAATGNTDGQRTEAEANRYFLKLLLENNQVNIFLSDPRIQQALELRAERRHQFVLDNVYAEANAYIAHLEATADVNHRQQLAFVSQSTNVLVGQLHSEARVLESIVRAEQRTAQELQAQLTRTHQECQDERSLAMRFDAHRSELEAAAHTLTAEHRQHEHHLAELRTSFDENRNELIEYLGSEFEEKLQWEENESEFRLTFEEQQYDSLIDDLHDRNAVHQGHNWLLHLADRATSLEEVWLPLARAVVMHQLCLLAGLPIQMQRKPLNPGASFDAAGFTKHIVPRLFDLSVFTAATNPSSTQLVSYVEGTHLAPSIVPVQQSTPQNFPAAKALPHFQDASAYAAYPTLQQTPVQASISLATPRPVQSSPAALRVPLELHPPALRAPTAGMMTSKENHQACDERNKALFDQLCKSHGAYSSVLQQLESSREGAVIRSRLLNKVSDTTAARYLRSVQLFFCAFEELGGSMEAIDQGLFLDAFFALSRGADSGPVSNSINVLKALRWYKKLLAIACMPDLYGTAFSLLSNPAGQEKRESIPLPLSFVAFLERMLLSGKASLMDMIWAGSFLVAIGASLRFADAQHIRWSTLCVSSFTLRGICYRTKTTKGGCPWGLLSFGVFSSSEEWGMTWLPHWLGALDTVWCEVRSRFGPDCLFFLWSDTGFAPASYSQALQKLRYMLTLSGIAPAQAAQYTLHSLKTTFLSWMSQLSIPLSSRFLQGHHKAPGSAQLYSRDDVWPALRAQWLLWRSIHAGFRPARPQHRGGQSPLVEPLVDTAGFQWVEHCPDLSCFSVGNDCQSFLALEQQDGDLRDARERVC